jgi:hypothetical protein
VKERKEVKRGRAQLGEGRQTAQLRGDLHKVTVERERGNGKRLVKADK